MDVHNLMGEASGSMDVRALVDEHYQVLYRYAYHLSGSAADAEDLTQETFCTAQEKIGQLRDPARARAWLCRILRNHYLCGRRAMPVALFESLETIASEPEHNEEPSGDFDVERLHGVLKDLPEAYRTPIILFYFEEFSYRQIADQMGVPIGTVMSRLARAKAYLRSCLHADYALPHLNQSSPGVI